jgi:copper chaperone
VARLRLSVAGMTCGTCEESISRALARVQGVEAVRADHTAERVDVEFDAPADVDSIRRAVEDAGYDVLERVP